MALQHWNSPPGTPGRLAARIKLALVAVIGTLVATVPFVLGFYYDYKWQKHGMRNLSFWVERYPAVSRSDSPTLRAELRDVTYAWHYFQQSPRLIGEIHNTGTEAIAWPKARLTLINTEGRRDGNEVCKPVLPVLEPGEKVPCRVTFYYRSDEGWGSPQLELLPLVPAKRRRAKLTVLDAVLHPIDIYPFVEGHVRNDSGRDLKRVEIILSMYGRDGRIVASDETPVYYNKVYGALPAGATAEFRGNADDYAATPVSVTAMAVDTE